MSAINRQSKTSSKNSLLIIGGVIAVASVLLFAYLMWYVSPEQNTETVRIIAVTESGCIAETLDGFSVNVGQCDAQPGDIILAPVDQKVKERQEMMNPTGH